MQTYAMLSYILKGLKIWPFFLQANEFFFYLKRGYFGIYICVLLKYFSGDYVVKKANVYMKMKSGYPFFFNFFFFF